MPLKDFVYAGRMLRKAPVFAITAVLTIALGIGASTAIFSVMNAVLLRPLPYRDATRLVVAASDMTKRDVKDFPFSNADYFDLRDGAQHSFEEFGTVVTNRAVMPREDGTPEQVTTAAVSTNFFRMLGAGIVAGRDFEAADGEPQPAAPAQPQGVAPAAAPRLPTIAILSHEYWRRRCGSSTAVLGHNLLGPKGGPLVVGILAPGFELLFPPSSNVERRPDIWVAARIRYDNANRNNVSLRVIGRLKLGIPLDRAKAEANVVAAELRRKWPIHETSGYQIRLEPMQSFLVGEVRPAILALMGAVVFLLLIACANVANLLLVRTSLRQRELAVRTALGGNRWRLIRQVLAEALLIAGLGAVLGLALAWGGIHELLAIAPANLPRLETIAIDPRVLAFTTIAALGAAALFGITPALRASRPDVMHVLRASGRTSGLGGGALLRNAVVVVEVALSFVLLIGSGLMVRTFVALQNVDPGYDPHHLLAVSLLGGRRGTSPQQRGAAIHQLQQHLASMPGIRSVTAGFPFPLTGQFSPIRWGKEEALSDNTKFQAVDFQIVLPGYFGTMHTPLIAGRIFNEDDNAPERKLVVVDQFLAAKAFPHDSAVGKRILVRINTPEPEWVQIIGVVAHQRDTSLADPGREQIYFTDGFLGHGVVLWWALRTAGDPGRYTDSIRSGLARFDPQLLLNESHSMEALVTRAQASTRFSLLLISVFAVIAALLAGVGLYGVLSTVVRQRTAEIGVRMAVGAGPASIFNLVVGHGMRLSAAGIGLGILAALGFTRVIASLLVGVKPTDPSTYAAIAVLFLLIAFLGAWVPARRAAGLDPTVALREE